MSINWQDCTEIVCGLTLAGKIPANAVQTDNLMPPYNQMAKLIKQGVEVEDLIQQVGLTPVQVCLEAAKAVESVDNLKWVAVLEQVYNLHQAGLYFERCAKSLKKGEDVDWASVVGYASKAQQGLARDLIPMSQVVPGEVPFLETGWEAFDRHTGGIPQVGLIIAGGQPGVGKTTAILRLAGSFAQKYPDKKVLIFSLEMILSELKLRFIEVMKVSNEVQERIIMVEQPYNVEQVIAAASTAIEPGKGLILVDFIDLMVKDNSENEYAKVYKDLAMGAKKLHVPVVALAQLNGSVSGLPKPQNLRYTRLAEALAWMILMLYNPANSWYDDDWEKKEKPLEVIDNHSYIIVWKIRGGFRKHTEDSPGAIAIPFRGDKGWHPKESKWFSLKKHGV